MTIYRSTPNVISNSYQNSYVRESAQSSPTNQSGKVATDHLKRNIETVEISDEARKKFEVLSSRSTPTMLRSTATASSPAAVSSTGEIDWEVQAAIEKAMMAPSTVTPSIDPELVELEEALRTAKSKPSKVQQIEAQELLQAKDKDKKGWKLAESLVDFVTDLIPGVGQVKDAYNLYKVLKDPKSKAKDVAVAMLGFVPGLGDLKSIAKLTDSIHSIYKVSTSNLDDAAKRLMKKSIKDVNAKDLVNSSEGKRIGNRVGHMLKEHVGLSNADLINRAKRKDIEAATTYKDRDTANKVVEKSINNKAEEIADWLLNTSNEIFAVRYDSDSSLGRGVYQNETTVHDNIKMAITIFVRDPNVKQGFSVLTSYPALKWKK
ncbi:RNase A-like domain-containing protein [Brevibacillus sp. SYSU BS000544]|uniref:RNase A-like domain-containing protein n=1 Tax=Brevibacillus sp. SYSU BS000544 TaxID=3416443 RepID=UPI003CE5A8B1